MNDNYDYPNRVILPYQYNNYYYMNNDFREEIGLNLYDDMKGYQLGNMFKSLYSNYKNIIPTIKANNEQERELYQIDALSFAAHDLNLYLDVHPNDREALNLFNKYKNIANEKMQNYENNYGAINISSDALKKYPWSWIKSPWPWEGKI